MSVQVEKLEKNMAKMTIEVESAELDKALDKAFNHQKNKINVSGFRKGKVPRQVVEKMYGPEVFYEDAANILMQQEYPKAYDESELEIVSQPTVDIVQLEKGKNFIFTAEVAVKPEVTLGKYKGITVTKIDTEVSEEEIDTEIETERRNNARTISVTRPIENGDTVILDFDGSVDGVPFEGGKAEGYSLEIGSHSFIDNFEDQLIGKNVDDETDVNVTFPEDYHETSLAGKPAVFKVMIHEIKTQELPELDDEFVGDVSEFDTVAEYREDVKKKLADSKDKQAHRTKEDEAISKIVEASEMDVPDAMVDSQVNNMINDYANSLMQSGLSFDQYLQFSGMTIDQFREQLRPDALQRISSSLVLEAIAKEEAIEATDADVDAKIEEMAKTYDMDVEELKKNIPDSEKKEMKKELAMEKAIDLVMDNVKERAKAKKKADKEEAVEE